jgi:hypothetical protein
MKTLKLVAAAALLSAVIALPSVAEARSHHRYHGAYGFHEWYGLPYPISYLHNYGPGLTPGTFAYYDGPSTNLCYQGSAAYIGQDSRLHPCF